MALGNNLFIGIAIGAVAGVIGHKIYQAHKAEILESLDSLAQKYKPATASSGELIETGTDGSAQELSLEELEKQKENLEDLIAEKQAQNS